MSNKKDLNKKELEKVTGGDYGRTWDISQFRQDYTAPVVSPVPCDTQFKPEDVGANSDLTPSKQNS